MDQDIPNILRNMHIVLLHGVDDTDTAHGKRDSGVQELYDLLPPTPMSPNTGTTLTGQSMWSKPHAPDGDDVEFKLPDNATEEKPKVVLTEMQEKMLSIEVRPLADIEWTDERHRVLCYWLDVCRYRFNFFSASQYEWDAIQRKKQLLSDILDYLDMTEDIWNDEVILKMIMKMIKANLFRSLPLTFRMLLLTPDYCQEDDGEDFEDPNYPHLCYVFEIALMFVRNINVDDRTRKKYLGKSFIIPLTELFASEDVREREYLKAILHGIYARNMRLRRLIRTQMSHCCWRVIYSPNRGDDIENGISECLQLVCSIIQGLTTPIKQEYKNILYNVLIPLHKANQRKLQKFHETLLACCIQFILKDLSIGLDILSGLLKYWPFQSAQKSDMFLKEVVIIINTMMTDIDTAALDDDDEDEEEKRKRRERNCFKFTQRGRIIGAQVIDKLIECMISDNHCLSEKALLAFGEVGVQKLIDLDKSTRWTRILSILFDNRDHKRHWCRPLHETFEEALDTFVIRDSKGVQDKEKQYKKKFAKHPINQFKNGYNPIYPSQEVFTANPQRLKKYEAIRAITEQRRKRLLNGMCNGHSPPPQKPLP